MKQLFFVVHDYSGAQTYARELFAWLDGMEDIRLYRIYLGSVRYSEFTVIKEGRVTIFYIPSVGKRSPEIYSRRVIDLLSPWVDREQDIIFHLNNPAQISLGKVARERLQARIVYTLHFLLNYFSSCERLRSREEDDFKDRTGESEIIKMADRVICVTRFGMEVVQTYYGKEASEISLVYNGYGDPEEEVVVAGSARGKLKEKFGFDPEEKIILFVGRIDVTKGSNVLIEAFIRLLNQYKHIRLVLAGGGSFAECLKLVGLNCSKVSFTGNLERAELGQLYRMAHIGVIPSLWEQCSYVALEMMACGLPVICSGVRGVRELIADGDSGCLLPVEVAAEARYGLKITPESVGKALADLLADEQLAERIGQNARALWRNSFHRGVMGQNTLSVYNHLCPSKMKTHDCR